MKFGPEEGENVAKVAGWRRYARESCEYREWLSRGEDGAVGFLTEARRRRQEKSENNRIESD